ncbi:hypothetical protein HJC23_011341 [Cyclotella cryptica]|uniref:Uncharacterized protein n=1 Tax=Cyclotella cryptica TaxID=29204 RepID=A0ABD3QW41_9STRA
MIPSPTIIGGRIVCCAWILATATRTVMTAIMLHIGRV